MRPTTTYAIFQAVAVIPLLAGFAAGAERPEYVAYAEADRFEAVSDACGVVCILWHTTLELRVGGFRVLRKLDDGKTRLVAAGWTAACGEETGGRYELTDPDAEPGLPLNYELWTVDNGQTGLMLASWRGTPKAVQQTSPFQDLSTSALESPAPAPLTAQAWIGSGSRIRAWTEPVPADRVRLSLREEGLYRVTAQELAYAMGGDAAVLADALAKTNLELSCQGQSIAWHGEGTNLYFYGRPALSHFAPENVYWLSIKPGVAMSNDTRSLTGPMTVNSGFRTTQERVGTNYLARMSYSSLASAPAPYVGFLPLMNAHGRFQVNEPLIDPVPGEWTGAVTVNLLSYNEAGTDNHNARVSVGGAAVGEAAWPGEQCVSFTYAFSSTQLAGAIAALTISNTLDANVVGSYDNTRFYCYSYSFTYPRLYCAHDGALLCTGGESNTVAVTGLAGDDALALDVTDPTRPALAGPLALEWSASAGSWTASFPCGGTDRVYCVCSRTRAKRPAVRGTRDVDWAASSNGVDYAILVPPEAWRPGFREAVQPLADFRTRQGLRTSVVDIESVYDCFSYGLAEPAAIQAFCRAGRSWSGHALRYVLLAGAGALDFKQLRLGITDYTACLIPTVILGQRFEGFSDGMTVSADQAFGDTDGDGVPEIAFGRLPTTKTQDVAVVVQKTLAYEEGLRWKRQVLLAPDWDNTGAKYYPFSAGTDRLTVPFGQAGRPVVKVYPTDNTGNLAPLRVGVLLPALSAGASLLHFFGHADELNLGGGSGKLLTSPAHISASNWSSPAVAVLMGCRANRWQSLTTTVCLLPYGLFAAGTGFVAGVGSTGNMMAGEAEQFAVGLYTGTAAPGTLRLGDVLLRGLRGMAGTAPAERILCVGLVGDPALVFSTPYRGTAMTLE